MDLATDFLRIVAAVCVLAITPSAGAAPLGTFDSGKTKIEVAGEYAFWAKSAGASDAPLIKVAVSNGEFVDEMFDPWFDRQHTINAFFADDDTKVVYFEFDGNAKYHGYSFYFGRGDGCGYCYDSQVRSTVARAGNRLSGTLSYKAADGGRAFDITIDVPYPDASNGAPLARDGGDPGPRLSRLSQGSWRTRQGGVAGRDRRAQQAALGRARQRRRISRAGLTTNTTRRTGG